MPRDQKWQQFKQLHTCSTFAHTSNRDFSSVKSHVIFPWSDQWSKGASSWGYRTLSSIILLTITAMSGCPPHTTPNAQSSKGQKKKKTEGSRCPQQTAPKNPSKSYSHTHCNAKTKTMQAGQHPPHAKRSRNGAGLPPASLGQTGQERRGSSLRDLDTTNDTGVRFAPACISTLQHSARW